MWSIDECDFVHVFNKLFSNSALAFKEKESRSLKAFIKKVLPPISEWVKAMTDTLSNLCFSSWRLVEHWLKSRKVALNPSRPSPVNLETVSAREQRNGGELFCILRNEKKTALTFKIYIIFQRYGNKPGDPVSVKPELLIKCKLHNILIINYK